MKYKPQYFIKQTKKALCQLGLKVPERVLSILILLTSQMSNKQRSLVQACRQTTL